MTDELLFSVSGSAAQPARPTTLAEAGFRERRDLQEWVIAHPHMLGDGVKIVTFEFDRWWSSSGTLSDRLDILGLHESGELVVAELKRDKAPDTTDMQAIKYAAMVSRFTPETLASHHARFCTRQGEAVDEADALARLNAHAPGLSVDTLRRPRIVLMASDFPPVLTATAVWLTEMGLSITLIGFRAYQTGNDTLISVSQIYPLRSIEEYTVTPRQAEVRAAEETRKRRQDTSTVQRLVEAELLPDGSPLSLHVRDVNQEMRDQIKQWVAANPARSRARWRNDSTAPLVWEADSEHYTPSGLARLIVQEATGMDRSLRGGGWWIDADGRSLLELVEETLGGRARLYLEFWRAFIRRANEDHPEWLPPGFEANSRNYCDIPSAVPGAHWSLSFKGNGRLRGQLYFPDCSSPNVSAVYDHLRANKDSLEASVGAPVFCDEEEGRRSRSLVVDRPGDIGMAGEHAEYIDWLLQSQERFRKAVDQVLRNAPTH